MAETATGIFDKLYAAGKQVYDEVKKPLIKNKIKRKLSSAYDDASAKIGEAELKIQKVRESFEDYNINTILEQKQLIKQAKDLQEQILVEYKELFGKEMVFEQD